MQNWSTNQFNSLEITRDLKKAVKMILTNFQGHINQFCRKNVNNIEDANNKGLPRVANHRTQSESSYFNEKPNNE